MFSVQGGINTGVPKVFVESRPAEPRRVGPIVTEPLIAGSKARAVAGCGIKSKSSSSWALLDLNQ